MSIDVGQAGGIPNGAVYLASSSGNVAASAASCSFPAVVGRTNYVLGAACFPMGATAGVIVNATITGTLTILTFPVAAPTGVAVGGTPVIITFGGGIPASAPNASITLNMPSLGTGNTNAAVFMWGYLL